MGGKPGVWESEEGKVHPETRDQAGGRRRRVSRSILGNKQVGWKPERKEKRGGRLPARLGSSRELPPERNVGRTGLEESRGTIRFQGVGHDVGLIRGRLAGAAFQPVVTQEDQNQLALRVKSRGRGMGMPVIAEAREIRGSCQKAVGSG